LPVWRMPPQPVQEPVEVRAACCVTQCVVGFVPRTVETIEHLVES